MGAIFEDKTDSFSNLITSDAEFNDRAKASSHTELFNQDRFIQRKKYLGRFASAEML